MSPARREGLVYGVGALHAAARGDRMMWALHRAALSNGIVPVIPAVAVAEGAKVDPDAILAGMMAMPGNMRSSMQKDVAQHKTPELEAIAGPILRGAAAWDLGSGDEEAGG